MNIQNGQPSLGRLQRQDVEAADLVGAMVRREPARRLRIAEVLGHVHWLGASEKLRRVCLLADTRPEEWDALAGVQPPAAWRAKLKELIALMGGSYGGGLQELARLLRIACAHVVENLELERATAELRAVFGAAVTDRDAVLVEYVAGKLPEAFLCLLQHDRAPPRSV